METYNVGANSPIKLKVGIETEAIPMTYAFLYHTINDQSAYSYLTPFDPTQNTGWKQLDNGNAVNGKIFRVISFLRFFNDFPDETTFDLAIKQVKDTYEPSINGGDYGVFNMSFKLQAFFSTKTYILESALELT
ncbi:hypothetical protein [Gelidibacter mesophilus]|uniref:hypothetical protein n=1 Tax=Gelidibacter mesophilus TaxID=169050 RepID=UPI0004227591|nr:hypothetical protein [Gelidibacter mesophilus]